MYVIMNDKHYIGIGDDNKPTRVTTLNKAHTFDTKEKADNYLANLKTTLKIFNWSVVKIGGKDDDCSLSNADELCSYDETDLEKSNFDIVEFFNNTITTVSQLRDYASNMRFLEREYNKKILDVRHYKRDINTKLNAIQLQRLEQFEIQLERERYECKSNRMIAEMFLTDLNRIENKNYMEVIRSIKGSEYKPEIFTFEMLDEIVGRKKVLA